VFWSKAYKCLPRAACTIWIGKRTSVAGDGKRAIGGEPDMCTPVNATGMMQTTPALEYTIYTIPQKVNQMFSTITLKVLSNLLANKLAINA